MRVLVIGRLGRVGAVTVPMPLRTGRGKIASDASGAGRFYAARRASDLAWRGFEGP